MTPLNLTTDEKLEWEAYRRLNQYACEALGLEKWRLLCYFEKVMHGSDAGLYVSGLTADAARTIVDDLMGGWTVEVHLMHRHKSGNYEASSLCLRGGRFIMVFDDRSEFA